MPFRSFALSLQIWLAVLAVPIGAAAQDSAARPDAGGASPTHAGMRGVLSDIGHDFLALPSVPNVWIASLGGVAAAGVHPFDDDVNQHLSSAGGLKAGGVIGNGITQVGGALTVYVIGRVRHQRRVAHTGMDLLRAQLVTGALTESIKVAVGRERPDGKPYSFPSGHASLSVATATVIYRHFGAWWSLPAYGAAAYVGASRLRENRHWLSDVVFGSAVGAIGGRTVTRHGRSNFAWAPVYLPHGGLAVLVSRTTAPRAVSAAPHERQEHRVAACAGSGSSDLVERPLR